MTTAALFLLFATVSQQYDLPKDLLKSICYVESHHDTRAVNPDDGDSASIGICQVKLQTARWLGFKGSEESLKDPKVNITYAGAYLSFQLRRYSGSIPNSISAYNSGTCRLDRKGNIRNKRYVEKVFKAWSKE